MNEFELFWPTGEIAVSTTILRIVLAILIAALTGYFLQKLSIRYGGRVRRTERMDSQENFLVSGLLVLLALMLAFTTGFVVEHYDQRRFLVIEEANAIGTAYLPAEQPTPRLHRQPHRTFGPVGRPRRIARKKRPASYLHLGSGPRCKRFRARERNQHASVFRFQ